MKIALPYAPRGGMGGGNRVLSMFEQWLDADGIVWTRDVAEADVALLNSWSSPLVTAAMAHARGIPIVHRLDNAAQFYGRTDGVDDRLKRINAMAARSIFQSQAVKEAVYPGLATTDGPVIHNPVDPTIFTPEGPPLDLPKSGVTLAAEGYDKRVSCVSWSDNALKGGVEIIALAYQNPSVLFVRAGRWPHVVRSPQRSDGAGQVFALTDKPQPLPVNVVDMGILDAAGIAALHRSVDALLTMSQSEACPNHVLEAMACGKPVIYRQDSNEASATKELVGLCGLPSYLMSVYKQSLAEVIQSLQDEKAGDAARQRVLDRYTPDRIFPQYLDTLREALAESQRGLFSRLWQSVRSFV